MKTRLLASLLLSTVTVGAQTVPAPVAATAAEEPHMLSPFTVSSERDTGYAAANTLAGTRLDTPVKDLGASISIFTKDLLNDLGVTSSNDLLIYAANMEAVGPSGNFSGASSDINATEIVGDGPRVDPQGSSRTRGLAAPNFTRGYFATGIAFDSYNTETVTANRGPNAILFGVGSPAGVVDTTTMRADLRRDRSTVSIRFGSNDSLRTSVDFNRVLLDRKLAVRLAALRDRDEFNQRPAFEEKKRVFGAATYAPYKATAFRANFEAGRTRANRPLTVLPFNSISAPWLAAGRPVFDWTFYDDPARNPAAATTLGGNANTTGILIGQAQLFDQVFIAYSSPTASRPDLMFRSTTPNTSANVGNAVKNQLFNPVFNRDSAQDQIQFLGTRNIGSVTSSEMPANYWTGANVLAGQLSGYAPAGIKMQGFTDYSAFDFRNRMLDETSRQGDSFHTFNLAFEQRAWRDRLGIELAYDTQRIDRRGQNSFFQSGNSNHVRADANVTLATGQPNPNVGRPYVVYGQTAWSQNFSQREAVRATGYLKYDFADLKSTWASWLGRHTLTGLFEQNRADAIGYTTRVATDGDAARALNPAINVFERRPALVVYLGPTLAGNSNPIRLEAIRIPQLQAGPLGNASYFKRAADATDPGALATGPASLVEVFNNGNATREVVRSTAAVIHSYWLREHVITMIGRRRDEDYFMRRTLSFVTNPADPGDPGKVHYGFDDFSFPGTPPSNGAKSITTYSVVVRWPQRLIRLPLGTELSVFGNESENFTPVGGRINAFGEALPSPRGRTREYGFNLSTFGGKFSLRANFFENTVEGQSYTPTVYNSATGNAVIQTASFWAVEGNTNPHLAAMRNADIETLFSALPANYRELYQFKVNGAIPGLSTSYLGTLNGASDTTDTTAKGAEVELAFNPTSRWRIMANVAKQETVKNNSLPFLKSFIARMTPVWNQLRGRSHQAYAAGWQPGDPVTTNLYGTWLDNNIYIPFATALATEGSASAEQRKWRANLVTNYTFGAGSLLGLKLQGWGVGAGVRWQDKLGIGYPTTRNADTTVKIDLAHPYYAPAETNVDLWISYERKIWQDHARWRLQFNARNVLGGSEPIAIGVQPWGEPSTVRLPPERRWYLTNTFNL